MSESIYQTEYSPFFETKHFWPLPDRQKSFRSESYLGLSDPLSPFESRLLDLYTQPFLP